MSTTASTRSRRSHEDWDQLAREILPELQAGRRISDFEDRIGTNSDALRTALARMGFDPHGEPMKLKVINAATDKTLAKRVARRRREKAPWWLIMAETDRPYGDLVRGLVENGYSLSGEDVSTNGAG